MATRSRIAVELNDGTVKSVYCHWDGYPSGVGNDLLDRDFTSTDEVEEFLDEGSRSTVEEAYYDKYGESRGEKRQVPTVHKDIDAYVKEAFDWEEYAYLYTKDGDWVVRSHSGYQFEKVLDVLE